MPLTSTRGGGRFRSVVATAATALCLLRAVSAQDDRRLPAAPTAEQRVALVVGIDRYTEAPLQNARNDARAVARGLEELGFRVHRVEDATRSALVSAVTALGDGLRPNDVALFYFAGHGVQVDGENFLIPSDFHGHSAAEVRLNSLKAGDVQQLLQAARVSLLIIDACRNNPFTGARSTGGGLAAMETRGSLIAFATGAGQTAADGTDGNGLFTQELLKAFREPGLKAQDVFQRVRQRVYAASQGKQFPAVYDGLIGEFVFQSPGITPGTAPESLQVGLSPVQATQVARKPLVRQLTELQARAAVITQGLDSLREHQRSMNLTLRSDMTAMDLRMKRSVTALEAETARRDIDAEAAAELIRAAEEAIQTLERFLNIPIRR